MREGPLLPRLQSRRGGYDEAIANVFTRAYDAAVDSPTPDVARWDYFAAMKAFPGWKPGRPTIRISVVPTSTGPGCAAG